MKPGDMVRLHRSAKSYVNMYEDEELVRIENGERFHVDEIGLVLDVEGKGNYSHLKVLTPRGVMGWIHIFRLEVVSEGG